MSHFRDIPLDEGALNGRHHGLRDETGLLHSGRWDVEQNGFVYSNGTPIVSYIARVPGNGTPVGAPG